MKIFYVYRRWDQPLDSSSLRRLNAGVSLCWGRDLPFPRIDGCGRNRAISRLPPSSLLRESSALKEERGKIQSCCYLSLLYLMISLRGMKYIDSDIEKIDLSRCFSSFFAL